MKRIGRTVTPGASSSTMSCDRPSCRLPAIGRRAAQHEKRVRLVRPARPHFLASDAPAVRHALGARLDRCEIGTRIRLAHAEREIIFAARNRRQVTLALRFGAIAQQARPGLAVGEPVRRARRRDREHFLGHDEAVEIRALLPAVRFGQVMPIQPRSATRRVKPAWNSAWPRCGVKPSAASSVRKNSRTSRCSARADGGNSSAEKST